MSSKDNGIVFSTDQGKMCPACNKPIAGCTCHQNKSEQIGDGNIRISRETKGRKGKGVTLISGVPLKRKELKALGKELKKRCGTGGTVKEGVIEIQGDWRDILLEELKKRGYTAKKSGG